MRFPIKPFEAASKTHDHVSLTLDYDKRAGGPTLHVQAVKYDPPITLDGFGSESHILCGSPFTRMTVETGWKTNSKKKLMVVKDQVFAQMENGSGPIYDAVVRFLKENGSELLPLK